MKLSEAWLREYVNPSVDAQALQNQLSLAGLEVDAAVAVAGRFTDVVVGHVLTQDRHSNADKLNVCQVDVGQAETLQIVCGAKNVAAGINVPVALVGAKLPGDINIKKSTIRGVVSQGMICSEVELGLGEQSEGILILPDDAPLGQDFFQYWQLDDHSIDIDLTPNRADCLSVIGIAREVGVINQCDVHYPIITDVPDTIADRHQGVVTASAACPRYLTRVIKGINSQATTPWQIVERLRRSGLRAIHPVVDVSNYIMLLLGQPTHAFDRAELTGDIQVRMAAQGEKIVLLDGKTIDLQDDTVLIADERGPLAIAGIMGGLDSGVTAKTQDIVLESAFFAPLHIAGKARQYGLHTDSSHRFERGVDPNMTYQAMTLATQMLLQIVGGDAGPIVAVEQQNKLTLPQTVRLSLANMTGLLGVDITAERVKSILQGLAFTLEQAEGDVQIWQVPSFRFDVSLEEDLIEEIARIVGYDKIPAALPALPLSTVAVTEKCVTTDALRQALIQQGLHEAMTYSFVDPKKQHAFTQGVAPLSVMNPISADMQAMRVSLIPGLLDALSYNLKRQQTAVRLFEIGHTFVPGTADAVDEPLYIAAVMCGAVYPAGWHTKATADFFTIKGVAESILAKTGNAAQYCFEPVTDCQWLHPGKAAKVVKGDDTVGFVGALHPTLKQVFDIKQDVFLFEFNYRYINTHQLPVCRSISKFPSIQRDIAIEIDESVSAQQVLDVIAQLAADNLNSFNIFDLYRGENIAKNKKSLGISLVFQADSHTLAEAEVKKVVECIVTDLTKKLGAQIREE